MIFEAIFEGGGTAQDQKSDQRRAQGFETASQARDGFWPPRAVKVRAGKRVAATPRDSHTMGCCGIIQRKTGKTSCTTSAPTVLNTARFLRPKFPVGTRTCPWWTSRSLWAPTTTHYIHLLGIVSFTPINASQASASGLGCVQPEERMANASMKKDMYEIENAKIWLDNDGIFNIAVNPGARVTKTDIEEGNNLMKEIVGSCRVPLLIQMREVLSMEREARNLVQAEQQRTIVAAVALLVGSPVSMVIGNLFIGLNKLPIPTRLFTSESQARDWLKGFVR